MSNIFRYQLWHVLSVIILFAAVYSYISNDELILQGYLWEYSAIVWFWLAMIVPVVHQVYVWLIWRLELVYHTFTKRFGVSKAFKVYAAGFSLLFASRLISIIILAISSHDSLAIKPYYAYILVVIITPIVIYLFYLVKKYFTIERAYGIDHFDKDYNEPYVKQGIFKYTDNGMYVFGLMILYLPGLLLFSKAALVVALFNHVYIWVHYYCTERPDMKVIYGKTPKNDAL